jgi:hypothetical protein
MCDYYYLLKNIGINTEPLHNPPFYYNWSTTSSWWGNNFSGFNAQYNNWIWGAEYGVAHFLTKFNDTPAKMHINEGDYSWGFTYYSSFPEYQSNNDEYPINGQIRCIKD